MPYLGITSNVCSTCKSTSLVLSLYDLVGVKNVVRTLGRSISTRSSLSFFLNLVHPQNSWKDVSH